MNCLKPPSIKPLYILTILIFFVGQKTFLQPLNMDTAVHPTELKLYKFDPKNQPGGKGLLNSTQVVQKNDTAYYFCKGLSIYSPAIVMVSAKDKNAPLQVSLHKWNWKEKSIEGSTDAKGIWSEKFKTENDFGIMVVTAKKPAVYNLYVWVGDEVKVSVPSDFVSMTEYEKKQPASSFFKKNLIYLVAGLLVIIAAIIIVIKKRKK